MIQKRFQDFKSLFLGGTVEMMKKCSIRTNNKLFPVVLPRQLRGGRYYLQGHDIRAIL